MSIQEHGGTNEKNQIKSHDANDMYLTFNVHSQLIFHRLHNSYILRQMAGGRLPPFRHYRLSTENTVLATYFGQFSFSLSAKLESN